MRLIIQTLIVAAVALASGCDTFRVAGMPTFGKVNDVAVSDIEAAVAAYRAEFHTDYSGGQIEVLSHDKIRIYAGLPGGSYVEVNRIHGKWRCGEVAVVTS